MYIELWQGFLIDMMKNLWKLRGRIEERIWSKNMFCFNPCKKKIYVELDKVPQGNFKRRCLLGMNGGGRAYL